MKDYMRLWNAKANEALPVALTAKEARTQKQSLFNELAFLSLQVLLHGKVKDEIALTKAVSKEGQFHELRQCRSNAAALVQGIIDNGSITIINKREKTSLTFTKAEILEAESPLFSIATAYKALREKLSDDDFMTLALEQEQGLTLAEAKKLSQGAQADLVNQGKLIYQERIEKEHTMHTLESLYKGFYSLSDKDQKAFLDTIRGKNAKAA